MASADSDSAPTPSTSNAASVVRCPAAASWWPAKSQSYEAEANKIAAAL